MARSVVALKNDFKARIGSPLASLGLLAVVVLFFAYPVLSFVSVATIRFSAEELTPAFFQVLIHTFGRTAVQAMLSATVATLLGALIGVTLFFLPWPRLPRRRAWLEVSGYLFFSLPGTAAAVFVIFLYQRALGRTALGLEAIVVAHVLLNFGIVAYATFRRLADWESGGGYLQLEAALCLGASRVRTAWEFLRAPLLDEARRWFLLILLFSFSSFSVVLILGGGPEHSTPEVLLYYSLVTDASQSRLLMTAAFQLLVAAAGFWMVRRGPGVAASEFAPVANHLARMSGALRPRGAWPLHVILLASLLPMAALMLWPTGEILRSVFWVRGTPSLYTYAELWRATGLSFFLATAAAGFSWLLYRLCVQSFNGIRRRLSGGIAVSGTFLLVAWSESRIAEAVPESELLRILFVALLISVAFVPMTCFWIEARFAALERETVESALLLGSDFESLTRQIVRPFLSDIERRVPAAVALLSLGEIAISGYFASDISLLPQLARRMASRYDFRGASWILMSLALATFLLYALPKATQWILQRRHRRGVT